MSQDLFAAFESEPSNSISGYRDTQFATSDPDDGHQEIWATEEAPGSTTRTTVDPVNVEAAPVVHADPAADDEDDFGDFEDASASAVPKAVPGSFGAPGSEKYTPSESQPAPVVKPKSFPPKASNVQPVARPEPKQETLGTHPFAGHMDLLFEAGDDEYDAGADELTDLSTNPEAAMAYSKRIIAEQEARLAKKEMSKPFPPSSGVASAKAFEKKVSASRTKDPRPSPDDSGPKKLRKKSGYVPARNSEVLFDADDESEHDAEIDDFGDFAAGTEGTAAGIGVTKPTSTHKQQSMPAIDLLGLDEQPSSIQPVDDIVSNPWSNERVTEPSTAETTGHTVALEAGNQVSEEDDAGWDDFETSAPSSQLPFSNLDETSRLPSHSKQTMNPTNAAASASLPPPNVPPPSVLLSVLPSLFAAADDALFNTLGKLDIKQRQILLAHPASHQFLRGYLGHCTVLAHIIAGRKLRWKRDQHLSQSMRIGPSAAGGKGGMKLAGVDKSEVAKEDREVLDAVRLWKAQVGKLRTAVTAASAAPAMPKLPAVPDIAEQMPVKSLKPADGGITAPYACALCGLKREERVPKVDVEVEDSFGEWWVQGTNMHMVCLTFWEEFERKLKSR